MPRLSPSRAVALFLLGLLVAPLALVPTASAAAVPQFFTDALVVGGLSSPRSLDFFPDGRILVVENGGTFVLVNGTTSTDLATLTGLSTSGEQGLLGVAIDPDFPTRPYVYVHYTTSGSPSYVQVSRLNFTNASGPGPLGIDLTSKWVLLANMPNVNSNHNGGTVRFGPDKMLYISIGDDAQGSGCTAQNLSFMAGKILRIKVDDTIDPSNRATLAPSDNPFFSDPRVNATLVWAYGLRNPFRFDIDPVTGTLYIGDVGQSSWEEVSVVPSPGSNMGWPYWEGNNSYRGTLCPTDSSFPTVVFPVYVYPNPGGASVIMAALYRGVNYPSDASFPPEFDENAFFFDFYSGNLRVLRSPNAGVNWTLVAGSDAVNFGTGFQYAPDMQVGPDGALYWVAESTSALRRISHDSVPQITTPSLPPGTAGAAYDVLVSAAGSPQPFTWSVTSGTLPSGLTLDPNSGRIAGIPTAAENASFVVQVNTSAGRAGSRSFNLEVADPVSIQPTTLPEAIENQPYIAPLAALGGVSPFAWALDSGALPPGLALSTSAGHITGTPTAPGHFTFAIRATDSQGRFGVQALFIHVIDALRVQTSSLPPGGQGFWYSFGLTATGGVPPYAWAVNGSSALPAGFTLGAANGTLYGLPVGPSATAIAFDVQDDGGQRLTVTLDLVIAPPPGGPPLVATTSLPAATEGIPYNFTLALVGGSAPYTWSADLASMPPGILLSGDGPWIEGVPTAVGIWTFEVRVDDQFARSGTRNLTLEVVPVVRTISITTGELPGGEVGVPYGPVRLVYLGVNLSADVRWSAVGLPAGLSLDALSGELGGVPTNSGPFTVTVRVFDATHTGVEDQRALQFSIARIEILTPSVPDVTAGIGVALSLGVAGASGEVTWRVVSGSLPPGLLLEANGTLHGTPTESGTYNFTVRAERGGGGSPNFEEKTYSMVVDAPVPPPPPPPPPPLAPAPASTFGFVVALLAALGLITFLVLASRRRRSDP